MYIYNYFCGSFLYHRETRKYSFAGSTEDVLNHYYTDKTAPWAIRRLWGGGGATHRHTHRHIRNQTAFVTRRLRNRSDSQLDSQSDSQWTHNQTHNRTHNQTHNRTHNQTHNGLTMDSQWTHNGLTTDSQWTHNGLTMDSQRTHKGLTQDSHQNHWKSIGFTRLSAKKVVFTLVLQGCPRKRLFLHWFYKVVREKCCFYIGFTKVVREKPYKTLLKSTFFVDNPPGMVSPRGAAKLPSQQP